MLTAATPLSRVRMRAQGVMGNLKRLLSNQVGDFEMSRIHQPSPQLMQAIGSWIAGQPAAAAPLASVDIDLGAVQQVALAARETTKELKKKASTDSEKATIEIVALMFQSILAEDRLPPGVRVWFARLQMPVLRVALGEPEFFESLLHPARKLIDRMGSCVMGFESAAVVGGSLEAEVKRVVQTIEQYPETGRRVFELVYAEFEKFLAKYLTEQGSTRRLATVAQQVEQREAMAIQYTIELRNMLKDLPVSDAIRDFLLKTWSDVMAVVAMQHGAQSAEALSTKQAAADLVWAAGAKPNRVERAKVIADLPGLLQRLRKGMNALALDAAAQDHLLKLIGDTLAQAFLSKTEAIDRVKIDELGKRLANLEDYFDADAVGDLPLDNENVELMLGIDTANIVVITDGGTRASEAMVQWSKSLELGAWFSLEHNHHTARAQFAWRSDRGNLNLFASPDGRNFLVQAGRLAAYLQAGLLLPLEEEALTVRATRDALNKLSANPERLLS